MINGAAFCLGVARAFVACESRVGDRQCGRAVSTGYTDGSAVDAVNRAVGIRDFIRGKGSVLYRDGGMECGDAGRCRLAVSRVKGKFVVLEGVVG